MTKLNKYSILIFLSIAWGTTWIAIKYSLEGVPPFLGAAARFSIAAICLIVYAGLKKINLKMSRNDFALILLTSVLLYLLDYGLIYWGEQYINAGTTAVFFATFPLFTGLVSNFVFQNEIFQWNKFAGIIIGFIGISIVFYDQLLQTQFEGIVFWASLAIIISAISAALSLVMVKKYLGHIETVSLTLHQMIWGVIMLGGIGFISGETGHITWNFRSLIAIIYMGSICSALAFVLYYVLLKQMSAINLSGIIYITPLVALFFGWLLLNEPITLRIIFGTVITFSGIGVSQARDYHQVWKGKRMLGNNMLRK